MFNMIKKVVNHHNEINKKLNTLEESIFEHFRCSEEAKSVINHKMLIMQKNIDKIANKVDKIIDNKENGGV